MEVATNLHFLAVEQWEKLQQNSNNSSQPPSSDNPYQKGDSQEKEKAGIESTEPETNTEGKEISTPSEDSYQNEASGGSSAQNSPTLKKSPGHQPGTPSQWRSSPLVAEVILPHYPNHCAACNQTLNRSDLKPYMGHYVLELEKGKFGFRLVCQLHHYYRGTCSCGHISQEQPAEGYVSEVSGRVKNLKLTEYVLVGPWLASLIASLGVRYRMSRAKIREFLMDWANTELGVGSIDRCIREAGGEGGKYSTLNCLNPTKLLKIPPFPACVPVVDQLVEELQTAEILHLDETPWYVKGRLQWLWVAITSNTAVFHIGSRKKEERAPASH